MPQAIAAAAQAAGAYAASAAAAAGASATVQTLAALAAYTATYAAVAVATTAVASALAPDSPKPEAVKATKRQARPSRISGNGRVRIGGAYMLFEASGKFSYDVFAMHDGRVAAFTGRYWLNDDEAFLDGAGWVTGFSGKRYTPQHVKILTRLGQATETAYAEVVSGVPDQWTNDHRGDAIASMAMICNHADQKYLTEDFPNGLPLPTAEMDLAPVFDPRDGAQSPTNPATFTFYGSPNQGQNAILGLLHYLCFAEGGPHVDYARRIAPVIGHWIDAANVCDEAVALKAGGTEPRYRVGGAWSWDSSPASIIKNYLQACDGWLAPNGEGHLMVYAGKYYAPGTDDVITSAVGYTLRRFSLDEDAVNELVISYVSPDHAYNEVETDPWRDESDILARGAVRSQPMSLPWVQFNGQARRLAKRAMSALNASSSGTITTNLGGLDHLGKRYLRITLAEEVPTLRDIIVEVSKAEIDLAAMQVTFSWARADPNIDAWSPASEEGDGVDAVTRADVIGADIPTIVDVVPFYEALGTGSDGVRLQVIVDAQVRDDLLYAVRWRALGGVSYNEGVPMEETAITGGVYVVTAFVPADTTLEVQVAAVTGAGSYTDWSATETADTSTDSVAPNQPTDGAATSPGAGQAHVTWRNPTSTNFDHARVWRGGAASSFGSATSQGTVAGAAGALASFDQTGVTAGSYRFWITAENAANTASPPIGPFAVTVT